MPKEKWRVVPTLESILTWVERAERLWWWLPMSAAITAAVFGGVAWLQKRPPEEIVLIVLAGIAVMLVILNQGPLVLRRLYRPRFVITVHPSRRSAQSLLIPIFIANRSEHSRLVVDFTLCLPLSDGQMYKTHRFLIDGLTLGVGAQEHTSGRITFLLPSLPVDLMLLLHEAYLIVHDHISDQSVRVKIPGTFPPK